MAERIICLAPSLGSNAAFVGEISGEKKYTFKCLADTLFACISFVLTINAENVKSRPKVISITNQEGFIYMMMTV